MANDPRHFNIRQVRDNLNRAEVETMEVAMKAIRIERRHEIADRRNLFLYAQEVGKNMQVELATYIAGDEYETETYHWVPKTWWDHFKARFYPKWLEKYFPIQTKRLTKTKKITILFPNIDIPERVQDTLRGLERGFKV